MKTTIEFRTAVHEVMIDMAMDCTFLTILAVDVASYGLFRIE